MSAAKDLLGQRFGRLTVVERLPTNYANGYIGAIWNCRCECGGYTVSASSQLLSGKRTSCGCALRENVRAYRLSRREDLTGRQYGSFTVLRLCDKVDGRGRFSFWVCMCMCGKEVIVSKARLINAKQPRCRCHVKRDGAAKMYDVPVHKVGGPFKNKGTMHPVGVFYGGSVNARGYVLGKVWDGQWLRRLYEHTFVMEQKLGRRLEDGEEIHHINGIKTDNRPENLELYRSSSEHLRSAHSSRKKRTP